MSDPRLYVMLFFLTAPTGLFAQIESVGWLVGKWKILDNEVYEEWKWSDDKRSLEGISYSIKNNERFLTEQITLRVENGVLFYVPDVAGDQPPVNFKISQLHLAGFIPENPDHNFPRTIQYMYLQKKDEEWIEATISGSGKSILYSFQKVK
jgi:hypothetical protein